jgi:hypothetical protein
MIGKTEPPGKCRAAQFELSMVLGAYQRPREKKPSSASTRITIRMIQRMLMRFDASLRALDCRPASNCFRRGTTKNLARWVRDLKRHPGGAGHGFFTETSPAVSPPAACSPGHSPRTSIRLRGEKNEDESVCIDAAGTRALRGNRGRLGDRGCNRRGSARRNGRTEQLEGSVCLALAAARRNGRRPPGPAPRLVEDASPLRQGAGGGDCPSPLPRPRLPHAVCPRTAGQAADRSLIWKTVTSL